MSTGTEGRQPPREPIALRPAALRVEVLAQPGAVRRIKLSIPPTPPDIVFRPRLFALLDAASSLPLTEVIAGAGYGKTTLLAAWARRAAGPVAWFSLDAADADLRRFVAHLAAAIRQAAPGSLPALDLLLAGNHPLDPAAIAGVLADDLLDLPAPLILIVDDVHAIAGSDSKRLISHLLRFPSPILRLVIGARAMPDLPEAIPLRGKGQAAFIGPDDLRFTPAEAGRLVLDPAKGLPAEELVRRTDGWPAGIRALGVAGASGAGRLPVSLRTLLDADVLAGQPPDLLALLSGVAIAERVSPALAAAMTMPGRADGESAARALLGEAERRGLFVTRLDEHGAWWRLHPLLRDALLADADPATVTGLHARAAEWFATADMAEEAIDHAILGDDLDRAADLLSVHAPAWLDHAEGHATDWMIRLPDDLLDQHPALLVARARDLINRVNQESALATARAEAAIARRDPEGTDASLDILRYELTLARIFLANIASDPRPFRDVAVRALVDHRIGTRLRGEFIAVLPLLFVTDGKTGEAVAHVAAALAASDGNSDIALAAAFAQAILAIRQGDLAATRILSARGMEFLPDRATMRVGAWLPVVGARARYEAGDLDGAIDLAVAAILDVPGAIMTAKSTAAHVLIRAFLAEGRILEARAALAADRRRIEQAGFLGLGRQDDALEALIDLAAGDLPRAARWADSTDATIPLGVILLDDRIPATQARIWLARNAPGDVARALAALTAVREHETAIHHGFLLARVLPLLAAAHAMAGDPAAARAVMSEALAIEPGVSVRRFADAGPVAMDLLAAVAADPDDPFARRAADILAVLGRTVPTPAAGTAPNPLTERETEILVLMATWKTNKEIAAALRISNATVRNHSVNIFRKLGVGDRRTAVDVARAAGWLPG
jgi:LuxR family maltose regulon positive regulatory protein